MLLLSLDAMFLNTHGSVLRCFIPSPLTPYEGEPIIDGPPV